MTQPASPAYADPVDPVYCMTIAGQLVGGDTLIPIINPATGGVVGHAPVATYADLEAAVAAANSAFGSWAGLTWRERSGLLLDLADAVEAEKEDLATILTLEQGKPRHTMAMAEIAQSVGFLRGTAHLELPVQVLRDTAERKVEAHHVPLGVVGAITPWNMPVQLSIVKAAPNLLCGNTVVLKPAPTTPLTVLRIGEIARRILPPGVLSVLSGDNELGRWIGEHPKIAKVSFTGSTATGKKVMAAAAANLKRVVLELGGNDPAIVLPDADYRSLIPRLFWAAFLNSGQLCIATKRLYVHASIYDDFLKEFVDYASKVRVGDGRDATSDLGPVQNRRQYEVILDLIQDARAKGYRFALGGEPDPTLPGNFVPVTILDNPPEQSRIVREEQFGPVLPVLRYESIDEVVARANGSPMGLAASVWGADAAAVAARLDVGTVWVNEVHVFGADMPFGGRKESGLGIERGVAGLAACTDLKVYSMAK